MQRKQYRASAYLKSQAISWWLWFALVMALALALGLFLLRFGPNPTILAWLIYVLGAVAILYKPRYGLYLILFFGLVGDAALMPWYPFIKNFSSRESIFFLHDDLIISPMEVYILLTTISWLGHTVLLHKLKFYMGQLFWTAVIFLIFVIIGLAYGIVTGGNLTIALWESRPLFYFFAMFILVSNLLTKEEHINHLIWAAILGIFIESIIGVWYVIFTLKGSLAGVESITEHAAAIHMNSIFIFAFAAWIYKGSTAKRILLPLMLPTVLLTYLATQRRAAFVSLTVALLLLAIVLYIENRRLFWSVIPVGVVLSLTYLILFWNSVGALGGPAQAIKSVIAPSQTSYQDQSSNLYRVLENINLDFTIHQRPLTGVGFGQKFYILVSLPDISFFEWWNYLPHNSIIWIWLKMGVLGFITTIFLIGLAVAVGAQALRRLPKNDLSVIALTAVLYVVMHFVYAYVDISWDSQSMIYIGVMMGILNCITNISSQAVENSRDDSQSVTTSTISSV